MEDFLRRPIYKKYFYNLSYEEVKKGVEMNAKLIGIKAEDFDKSFEIKKTEKGVVVESPYKSLFDMNIDDEYNIYDSYVNIINNKIKNLF